MTENVTPVHEVMDMAIFHQSRQQINNQLNTSSNINISQYIAFPIESDDSEAIIEMYLRVILDEYRYCLFNFYVVSEIRNLHNEPKKQIYFNT